MLQWPSHENLLRLHPIIIIIIHPNGLIHSWDIRTREACGEPCLGGVVVLFNPQTSQSESKKKKCPHVRVHNGKIINVNFPSSTPSFFFQYDPKTGVSTNSTSNLTSTLAPNLVPTTSSSPTQTLSLSPAFSQNLFSTFSVFSKHTSSLHATDQKFFCKNSDEVVWVWGRRRFGWGDDEASCEVMCEERWVFVWGE